jgi:predicted ATP-dependent serine protease
MQLANRTDIAFGTNILDIEVPEYLKKKFKVGVDYIDGAMGGEGFTPSAVTLFTGTPGAGKTTLALKLADSVTKKGGICLFNTAEESLYQTSMTAKRLKLKNGFLTGNTDDINVLLQKAQDMVDDNKGKQFFLIVDSLQCLDDGKYSSGMKTSGTAIRCLQLITNFCKDNAAVGVIINQVNKQGKMAGSNKLKHMCDSHMHLSVEEKEQDLIGCRILEVQKNRFGGCGHIFFLNLGRTGFRTVAKVSCN